MVNDGIPNDLILFGVGGDELRLRDDAHRHQRIHFNQIVSIN